jgi:ABC-type phosphate transport system permease subunit
MKSARTQRLAFGCIWAAALLTLAVLALIIGLIMFRGLPSLSWGFLTGSPENLGRDGGILPTIVGTVVLGAVSLPTPSGVGSAIYLTEYTHETAFTRAIRFGTESLAGVPSIIFGLFGFIFFVTYLQINIGADGAANYPPYHRGSHSHCAAKLSER